MRHYPRIFLITLLLPCISILAYLGAKILPSGPIPYILSFLVILPNLTGLLLVNTFFPVSVSNPTDPFHMISGIMVNWLILAATLTLIRAIVSLRGK